MKYTISSDTTQSCIPPPAQTGRARVAETDRELVPRGERRGQRDGDECPRPGTGCSCTWIGLPSTSSTVNVARRVTWKLGRGTPFSSALMVTSVVALIVPAAVSAEKSTLVLMTSIGL